MDVALKQRLVGASVLIALAVIVLPMLLSGRPEGSVADSQKIEIPPQPAELDIETRRYPIGEAGPASTPQPEAEASAAPPQQAPVEREAPAPTEAARPAASGAAQELPAEAEPELEPDSDPPRPLPAAADAVGGRYVVQVASFGSEANANRLAETLGGYGYAVLLDSVKSDVGILHRIRVGPYATEQAATEAVGRLKGQVDDIEPRIMDLQPDAAAPVSTESDPLARWVVQLGSFSSAANADKLVAKLRQDGLSAYREEVTRSGSSIYRVRVGPFLDREEAIRTDQLTGERYDLDGVVMSTE